MDPLLITSLLSRSALPCPPHQCCVLPIEGQLLTYCPSAVPGHYNLPSLPPPWILPNWEPKHPRQNKPEPLGRVGSFDLNILNLNVWGLGLANRKNERMPAIAEMLLQSDYDVVLVQEAWYNADYRILARTFPHVTFYGTPGSHVCPKTPSTEKYFIQPIAIGCHGLMIMSRWPIVYEKLLPFKNRVPWYAHPEALQNSFIVRGALTAVLKVNKGGVQVYAGVVNTHLTTWYGPETKWSSVREAQMKEVLTEVDSLKHLSDIQILGGDLNSKPESQVYQLPRSIMTDSLVGYLSDAGLPSWHKDRVEYHSWGHHANTWTEDPKEGCRIDYIWYALTGRTRTSGSITLEVSSYINRNPRMAATHGRASLSDHNAIDVTFIVSEV